MLEGNELKNLYYLVDYVACSLGDVRQVEKKSEESIQTLKYTLWRSRF